MKVVIVGAARLVIYPIAPGEIPGRKPQQL